MKLRRSTVLAVALIALAAILGTVIVHGQQQTESAPSQVEFGWPLPVQHVPPGLGRGVRFFPPSRDETLDFTLYALDMPGFVARYGELSDQTGKGIDLTGLRQVADWTVRIVIDQNGWAEAKLPSEVPPGLYVLDVRSEKVTPAQAVIMYTDYGLVAKQHRDGHLVWVTHVPDGTPAPAAVVTLLDETGTVLDTAVTDASGIANLDGGASALFAWAEVDDQPTLVAMDRHWYSAEYWYRWGGSPEVTPPEYTGHVHTDRPIYRPGHTVHYKATLRHIERDGFRVVGASTPVSVTIKDAAGNAVARANPTTDDFGSIAGDLVLGDDVTLGDWRIEVTVGPQVFIGLFQVEEYVKPDYEVVVATDRPFYVRGDTARITVQADYYFGQPASGADVTLRVYRGYYRYGSGGTQIGEVTGKTDASGAWSTPWTPEGQASRTERYYFEAEVVDATRRPVVEETSVPVHPAAFNLTLTSERYGVEAGQPVVMHANVMGHDGVPVAGWPVDIEVTQYVRYGNRITIRRETLTTGADGIATLTLPGLESGWYRVQATARDAAGHVVTYYSYAWLYSRYRPWYWYGGLEVSVDQDRYAPGDTARLLIKSPITSTALVTLEREGVYEEIVVDVSGATVVELPVKAEYAPNVWAKVHVWEPTTEDDYLLAEGVLRTAEVQLLVPADDKRLSVEITTDADTHEPRDEATFTITVRDAQNRPVEAQLSFALVDKAVLALAEDRNGHIFDGFWRPRSSTVDTYDSLRPSQEYGQPGLPDFRGGNPGEEGSQETGQSAPRREFPDTAYWKADIVTGPDGTAEVTLTLPDSLTTWRALARAVTLDTRVGQGTGEMVVTKPIIADPAMPRFAVQGDRFALDVLARNYHGGTLDASCTLDTPGLTQLDPGPKALDLPFNETRIARWTVVASQLGVEPVTARLTTSVGGDAIELPLEVQPFSVPDRFVRTGSTDQRVDEPFEVPFNAIPETSSVEVRLAPSMALGILDGLEDLIGYPYGCIEQTMSRMMPNFVVGRLVTELDIRAPEITAQLGPMMVMGLQKIYGYQHGDGSWGWWRSGGNVYLTAYVLHGLTLAQQSGYDIDAAVTERGFTWLSNNIARQSDRRIQSYAAYVLTLGGHPMPILAESLYVDRSGMDAFALAALALNLDAVGRADLSEQVLDELEGMAVETLTTASWPLDVPAGRRWSYYHWRTMASTEKNTATALLALANLRPESPLAPKAARWLMENKWGRGWSSTQATAFAVLALTDYIVASGELWSEYDWTVALDGDTVAQGRVDHTNVTERIAPITIGGDRLTPGDHVLTLSKQGDGNLFYSAIGHMALYYDGFQPTAAQGFGISLSRAYTPISGRSGPGGWQVGDVVNVRLTLETVDDLHYMIIEDMLPAGLEALNERLDTESTRVPGTPPRWRWWGYERKEIRDEKVTFFDTYLPAGTHTFDYAARAVTPGVFSARPVEAYAMYRPEVWGRSASDRLTIDEQRILDRPFLAGDFDRDCRLTGFDASLVATDWPAVWPDGRARDLSGDGDVDVADIATAAGRSGLACGDVVPLPPGRAGELTMRLRAPDDITTGQSFVLEVLVDGRGEIGGYDLILRLPDGAFEVLGAEAGDLLPGAFALRPVVNGSTVRFGGYSTAGAALRSETVLARLRLRASGSDDAAIDVTRAQVVTDDGGEFAVTADGTVVSPEPWSPRGSVYLPVLAQRRAGL